MSEITEQCCSCHAPIEEGDWYISDVCGNKMCSSCYDDMIGE